VARTLQGAGLRWFGVASVEEGAELRRAGIEGEVLLLGGLFPEQAEAALHWRLTPAITTPGVVEALEAAARPRGGKVPVHLKVDTGMGRLGIAWHEVPAFLDEVWDPDGPLTLEGVFTHLARADEDAAYTAEQLRRLREACAALESRGHRGLLRHAANSVASLRWSDSHLDLVRPGIALFGLDPVGGGPDPELRPVLHWRTRALLVKDVPEGTTVGYGSTWRAPRRSRIATLPVGYADGYARRLGSEGIVRLRGVRCPVVGRVSMDLLTVDVTELPDLQEGEEAWLLGGPVGPDPPVTAEEMARALGTIPYEVTCRVGGRVPRLFLRDGVVIEVRGPRNSASGQ